MRNILVLGAGQSTPYLVHDLLQRAADLDWCVTVGDLDRDAAAERIEGHARGRAVHFDVNDASVRSAEIEKADVVINMLAPAFQHLVAWDCVAHGRHMLSVSYRDQAVRDLSRDAHRKGVLLLCELGLDPGIDHMSAVSTIERIRSAGGRILSFRSYGSGIPAPDQEVNPLRYAITWNPRNVVMAGEHGAQFMDGGKIKLVSFHNVFHHTWPVEVEGIGTLEAYPNRDAIAYMRTFGLEGVHTMIRGTLRYPGWCETWEKIVRLGLPNESLRIPNLGERTYREVVEMFLPETTSGARIEERLARFLHFSPTGRIMENLSWLGLFSEERIGCMGETPAAMLVHLLKKKLPRTEGMRDLVLIMHQLEVEYERERRERISTTMVAMGMANGFTAMSKTVGLPTAITARLLLTGRIELAGSHIPTHPSVYEPVLREIADEGIVFHSKSEPLQE